jgi:hypothetical protein
MFFHSRSKDRSFHLGPFLLEALSRDAAVSAFEAARPAIPAPVAQRHNGLVAEAVLRYCAIAAKHIDGDVAPARAHFADYSLVDFECLAVLSGLNVGCTDALRVATGLRYWWGINGAQSGRERRQQAKRASQLERYPMDRVGRVERPTTLILDDEVPRAPKRAAFFERALQGDLGEKSQRERTRFSFKHPLSRSRLGMIRKLVPEVAFVA